TTLLREMLDRAADGIGTRLKDQPLVSAELKQRIADAYVGILEFSKAERLQRQALETRRKLLRSADADVAHSLLCLGETRRCQGEFAEAASLDREAATIYRKLGHPSLANALYELAVILEYDGKFNEAEVLNQEAVSVFRRTAGDHRLEIANGLA